MSKKTLVEPKTVKLLYEIGLSAASRGFGETTRPIFDAFAQCFPQHAGAAIGYAMLSLSQGDTDYAIEILKRDGITKQVCAQEAKGLLLVAYNMAGRQAEAQALQAELMQTQNQQTQQPPEAYPGSDLYHSQNAGI